MTKNEFVVGAFVFSMFVSLQADALGIVFGLLAAILFVLFLREQINSYRIRPGVVRLFDRIKTIGRAGK